LDRRRTRRPPGAALAEALVERVATEEGLAAVDVADVLLVD